MMASTGFGISMTLAISIGLSAGFARGRGGFDGRLDRGRLRQREADRGSEEAASAAGAAGVAAASVSLMSLMAGSLIRR